MHILPSMRDPGNLRMWNPCGRAGAGGGRGTNMEG